ncbi:MAG: hypothetical protein QXQ70_10600 [Candidatus Caldarchaeum sp.]
MLWKFVSTYELPASPGDVYSFFCNVENMTYVMPAEMGMKLVSVEGDVYTVSFNYLGQRHMMRFRTRNVQGLKQFHETLDFPFGRLQHTITVEGRESMSHVVEYMELKSRNPFAGYLFKKVLEYRQQAIKHRFGVGEKPVYRDPLKVSTFVGNAISIAGVAAAYGLLFVCVVPPIGGRLLIGLISFILLWFFTHDLTHFMIGKAVGIRFGHYYIGLSNIVHLKIVPKTFKTLAIALGIKIDRERSRASPHGYAAMYTAGPLASMLTPLTVPLIMLSRNPSDTSGLILLAFAAANIIFTAIFSPRAGCFAKARNALQKKSPTKPPNELV